MRRRIHAVVLLCALLLLLTTVRADDASGWTQEDGLLRYYDVNQHTMRTGLYAAYGEDGDYGLYYFDPDDGHLVTSAEQQTVTVDNIVYPIGADGRIDHTRIRCAQPTAVSMMLVNALRQLGLPYDPADGSGGTSYAKSPEGENIGFYTSDGTISGLRCSSLVAYCLGGSTNDRSADGSCSDGYAGQAVTLLNDLLSNDQALAALAVAGWEQEADAADVCAFVRLDTGSLQPGDVIFYNNDSKSCGCYDPQTKNYSRWLWLEDSPSGADHLHVHHAALYLGGGLLLESSHQRSGSTWLRDQPDGMRLQDWNTGSQYYYPVFAVRFSSINPDRTGTFTPLSDVAGDAWYAQAVRTVYQAGWMRGNGDGRFGPDTILTRGQLLTVLYRASGAEIASAESFRDIAPDSSLAAPALWAMQRHIASGTADDAFRPEAPVTRQQAAVFLYRFAASQGLDTGAVADLHACADEADVEAYAYGAMVWVISRGILTADADDCLNPNAYLTRAQFATMLARYHELRAAKG